MSSVLPEVSPEFTDIMPKRSRLLCQVFTTLFHSLRKIERHEQCCNRSPEKNPNRGRYGGTQDKSGWLMDVLSQFQYRPVVFTTLTASITAGMGK
jgi:hypothetical protein